MKLLAFVALLSVVASSCGRGEPRAASVPFVYDQRIGWMHGPCLAITNADLKPGTPVALVTMGAPQKVANATIQDRTTSATTCPGLSGDRASQLDPKTAFYTLQGASIVSTDMAIGIINPPSAPTIQNGIAMVDLEQNGISEIFTSCTATEGINFYVWPGKAYSGEPRWTKYYYLGYDMTPNCP